VKELKNNCIVVIKLQYIPEIYISVFSYRRKMEMISVSLGLKKKPYSEQREIAFRERNFLICSSCFWCASYLTNVHSFGDICPSCKNDKVESMPISFDETYKFNYDSGRGVILEFGRIR
jgi:hypothetical protein